MYKKENVPRPRLYNYRHMIVAIYQLTVVVSEGVSE